MSHEVSTIAGSRSRPSWYARASLAVTAVAAGWFVVELLLAKGWRDAMVFHDAGRAVASLAMLLALLAWVTSRGNRRLSCLALVLSVLAFAFFLLVVPL